MKRFIFHFSRVDGVILLGFTATGRARHLVDLWCRLKIFAMYFLDEWHVYRRPFRIIKSLRAAAVMAWTFDKKLWQSQADSSGVTMSVGKLGENGVSPLRGETSTRCVRPQSGQRMDDNSSERE